MDFPFSNILVNKILAKKQSWFFVRDDGFRENFSGYYEDIAWEEKKMAKTKFQDTLKNGLIEAADARKKIADAVGNGASVAISKGKEQLDKATQKKDEMLSSQQMVDILDVCYGKALDGIPKVSKSVDELAADYSSKYPTVAKAAKALVANQLVKCTTSGFLTGLGGIITLPVAVPANVSSVLYVQLRMIAAVAKLGGYEPNTDQVQTLVYACMTGQAVGDVLKGTGIKLGTKIATASIEKISGATLTRINQAVGFRLITKFGQTGIINLGKMVPLAGGVIGGGFDLVTTKIIAQNALKMFIETTAEGSEQNDSDTMD